MTTEREYTYTIVKNNVKRGSFASIRFDKRFEKSRLIREVVDQLKEFVFDDIGYPSGNMEMTLVCKHVRFGLRWLDYDENLELGLFRPSDVGYVFDEDMSWVFETFNRSDNLYRFLNVSKDFLNKNHFSYYDEEVIYEDGALESLDIFVHRIKDHHNSKNPSGLIWYVGLVENMHRDRHKTYVKNREREILGEVLNDFPCLCDVMRVPEGTIVVVRDNTIVSLLDRNDNEYEAKLYKLGAYYMKYFINTWDCPTSDSNYFLDAFKSPYRFKKPLYINFDVFGGAFAVGKKGAMLYFNPIGLCWTDVGISYEEYADFLLDGRLEILYESIYSKRMIDAVECLPHGESIITKPMMWLGDISIHDRDVMTLDTVKLMEVMMRLKVAGYHRRLS